MSLVLLQNATAMSPSLTLPFVGSGGTPPYAYSVIPGGVGGSINASTGIYTSPNATGVDVIEVTDSLLATATAQIVVGNALELFCDVIRRGMGLGNDQVYLWDQKIFKGSDSRLYIAISAGPCKPFGNTNVFDSSGNQIQSTNFLTIMDLDIYSRGPDARDRKEEVILALNSQYAEQQMELNSFRALPISTHFVNLSLVDGAAIPYRYRISVGMQYFVSKTSAAEYFGSFPTPSISTNP